MGTEAWGPKRTRRLIARCACSSRECRLGAGPLGEHRIGSETRPRVTKDGCRGRCFIACGSARSPRDRTPPARPRTARPNARCTRRRALHARPRTTRGCARCTRRRPLLTARASFAGHTRFGGRCATRVRALCPRERISVPCEGRIAPLPADQAHLPAAERCPRNGAARKLASESVSERARKLASESGGERARELASDRGRYRSRLRSRSAPG